MRQAMKDQNMIGVGIIYLSFALAFTLWRVWNYEDFS